MKDNLEHLETQQPPLIFEIEGNGSMLDTAYWVNDFDAVIASFVELQDLSAVEVYLRNPGEKTLSRVLVRGKLDYIWQPSAFEKRNGILTASLERKESRNINLPNRRMDSLNDILKQKAFGQVVCVPIEHHQIAVGLICLAHTRQKFLSDDELNFIHALAQWISGMMDYERKNQQIRAEIVSEERERIGMDLHDGIIQSLYGIGLSLEHARMDVKNGKSNGVIQIEKSLSALEAAIADIRAYILDLRPRQLRHRNLLDGMKSLIREFRANTMVDVKFEGISADVDKLAKSQMDALYHIFQESLSNTAKHAKATSVSIRIWRRDDRVMLRVSDNGQGFETGKSGKRLGHGLANMKARAEGVGGGLEVVTIRNQGTKLLAWVPYTMEEKKNA